jgi:cytoskeletal protein CcmA (bactofilin family)
MNVLHNRYITFTSMFLSAVLAAPLAVLPASDRNETAEHVLGSDQFIAGGTVWVAKPVAGDLMAAGGNVDIEAAIKGDAILTGGNVRLNAAVEQGVYAAGGRVLVNATVQRNARLAGGTVEIGPQARIAGNVSIGGGEVRVIGAIGGYLQAGGGSVYLDGPVDGNVEVGSGTLELGPNARINGRLRYASHDELRRNPTAQINGGIERFKPRADWPMPSDVQERLGRGVGWVWSAGLLMFAAILATALPGAYARVGETVRRRWPLSLLIGFIALVCIPVAAMLIMFTVIGVPLALATVAAYLALLVVGYVSAGIVAGVAEPRDFGDGRGFGRWA